MSNEIDFTAVQLLAMEPDCDEAPVAPRFTVVHEVVDGHDWLVVRPKEGV